MAMSGPSPIESQAPARTEAPDPSSPDPKPCVRGATQADLAAVVSGVSELLRELGSEPPPASAMLQSAQALLDDPAIGALLVAQAGGAVVGVLSASWQTAMHVPGRYALIQDLWVRSDWRSRSVGGDLLAALFALARDQGVTRAEVGLPRESFQAIGATEAFYQRNGFAPLGPRMRRVFS